MDEKNVNPYQNLPVDKWKEKTEELIKNHPVSEKDIVESVLEAWDSLLSTKIAGELKIAEDVYLSPQITGNFLHELIPIFLEKRYPEKLRKENKNNEKDIVFLADDYYSIEIKTSSSKNNIYGNRSYGQQDSLKQNKKKDGYYIAVNFEKMSKDLTNKPVITKIRFGWIDHTDWISQKSATGQQARLSSEVEKVKLKTIYTQLKL